MNCLKDKRYLVMVVAVFAIALVSLFAIRGRKSYASTNIGDGGQSINDLNGDGRVSLIDVVVLQNGIRNGFNDESIKQKADANMDGTVDIKDTREYLKYIFYNNSNNNNNNDNSSEDTNNDVSNNENQDSKNENNNNDGNSNVENNENNSQDNNDENVSDGGVDNDVTDDNDSVSGGSSLDMNEIQQNLVETEPSDSTTKQSNVQYGTYEKKTFYSDVCQRNKEMNILLPANYDSSKKYPVMYVLHGYFGNEDTLTDSGDSTLKLRYIIGNAIAAGEAEDMICVFPDIFASATQDSCTGMNATNTAAYDNFINVLLKEIMPYMEENYPIKTGRDNTAITGFSMGGKEALVIGLSNKDIFGYVGSICAAPGVSSSLLKNSDNLPNLLMISAGSSDNVVGSTPSGYHNTLDSSGITHVWHYVNGGAHSGTTIRPHMYNFVRYVFK